MYRFVVLVLFLSSLAGTETFNPVKIQIILCGDVHPNPGPNSRQNQNHQSGPDLDPGRCSVCARKMARNHRAMCCDQYELWFHMKCDQMKLSDYKRYRNKQQFNWICPACLRSVLPFTDNSFLSDFDEYYEQEALSDAKKPNADDDNSLKQAVTLLNSSPKNLKIEHLNICSIRNKMGELRVLQSLCRFDVIAITETHLDGSISDNHLHIEGWFSSA